MESPWDILGIEGETATTRTVKSAYARLAKSCRPDRDPEGFRRLHEAYLEALNCLPDNMQQAVELPAQVRPEDADEERTDSSRLGDSVGDAAVSAAIDALEGELKSRGEILAAIRNAEMSLTEHPGAVACWSEKMADLLKSRDDVNEFKLSFEILVFELRQDENRATRAAIARMNRLSDLEAINDLGRYFLTKAEFLNSPDAALAVASLACADACGLEEYSERLYGLAYPNLSRAMRESVELKLENCTRLGMALKGMPPQWQLFWRHRILHGADQFAWKETQSLEAIEMLTSVEGRRWPGFAYILGCLPTEVFAEIPGDRRRLIRQVKKTRKSWASALRRAPVFLIVYVVAKLIGGCAFFDHATDKPRPIQLPPTPPEVRKIMEDEMRRRKPGRSNPFFPSSQ